MLARLFAAFRCRTQLELIRPRRSLWAALRSMLAKLVKFSKYQAELSRPCIGQAWALYAAHSVLDTVDFKIVEQIRETPCYGCVA